MQLPEQNSSRHSSHTRTSFSLTPPLLALAGINMMYGSTPPLAASSFASSFLVPRRSLSSSTNLRNTHQILKTVYMYFLLLWENVLVNFAGWSGKSQHFPIDVHRREIRYPHVPHGLGAWVRKLKGRGRHHDVSGEPGAAGRGAPRVLGHCGGGLTHHIFLFGTFPPRSARGLKHLLRILRSNTFVLLTRLPLVI